MSPMMNRVRQHVESRHLTLDGPHRAQARRWARVWLITLGVALALLAVAWMAGER